MSDPILEDSASAPTPRQRRRVKVIGGLVTAALVIACGRDIMRQECARGEFRRLAGVLRESRQIRWSWLGG